MHSVEEKLKQHNIVACQQSKNVFRVETRFGPVIYYSASDKWQHKGKNHCGSMADFRNWLKRQGMLQ